MHLHVSCTKLILMPFLKKQITRSEFLKYLGLMLLGIIGFSSLFKSEKKVSGGFGSGAYGV